MDDTGKLRVNTRREYTMGVNCIFFSLVALFYIANI
jgi:hypothetical protein